MDFEELINHPNPNMIKGYILEELKQEGLEFKNFDKYFNEFMERLKQ